MHDAPPLHYTMKTAAKTAATGTPHSYTHAYQSSCHSNTHSHPHAHSFSRSSHSQRPSRGGSTTPLASPKGPYSVGQNQPPKLSPGRDVEIRSSSPNYFGLVVEASSPSGTGRNNWSPPSSSVKSFGAAIPTQVPLDANPEFEAFKRQADLNRGKSFTSSSSHQHAPPSLNPTLSRPRPPRWHTHASDTGSEMFVRSMTSTHGLSAKMDVDQDGLHDSAYVSADSNRNSESSPFPLQLPGQSVRFESPRPMEGLQHRPSLTKSEDRDPRLSLMEHRPEPPSPKPGLVSRASTLPTNLDSEGPAMIPGEELRTLMKNIDQDSLLLLDIRSTQNYATSRIKGALNLCIPTTLLKRATFNIQKLQQTFQGSEEADKFSQWRDAEVIVVYDSHASDHRDAVTAQNMVKKFTNEGFAGKTCILKGGFATFKENHPDLVDAGSPRKSVSGGSSCAGQDGQMAPVIGGVSLPATANGANPFFSNIRQNMDLADGVGQFEVQRPQGLASPVLPPWLREAVSEEDKGKKVSEKFLKIEKEEKSRMQLAYAAFDPNTAQQKQTVQLCGVEKGGKNRYKDILPFEHARVKLQEKPEGACDYVNASHLKTSRSNKRYIASQGPLPATFEVREWSLVTYTDFFAGANTIKDFWSVIWEQDVRVLVMLTAESEGGQLKCHSYWKQRDYGPIILKPLSEKKASLDIDKHRADTTSFPAGATMGETGRRRANTMTTLHTSAATPQPLQGQNNDAPHVIIRKFALSHASHPFAPIREITQLHFPSWPDFGTPANPAHLLALVELANVMQRAALPVETASIVGNRSSSEQQPMTWFDDPESDQNTRPMLVHCSAGCGRTGSFCAVDSVIDMLKRQRRFNNAKASWRDFEGDTPMDDPEDPVSPRSSKRKAYGRLPSNIPPAKSTALEGSSSIDTRWLQDESVDLVQTAVEEFRQQRLSMVQSLRQFVLCYETVLEWAHRMNDRGATLPSGRTRGSSLSQARP